MTEKLDKYNQKRHFEKTAEPAGNTEQGEKPDSLRFVVQHHLASRDHFDFRLEWQGTLLSWAVPKGPSYNPKDKRLAVQVEPHPIEYRNFEGTIPKGEYGGGVVMLWDEGYWQPLTDVEDGLDTGSLKFFLEGSRLKGKWALVRLKAKEGETRDNWLLMKEKDEYAKGEEGIVQYTVSVRSGRTMDEIEQGEKTKTAKNPVDSVQVQLARLVSAPPEGADWIYEPKYDGYRIVAFVEANTARLMTRNGKDFSGRFKDIAQSLAEWSAGRAMILDGEAVVTDEQGRTDFQALQSHMRNATHGRITYAVFDILALDGEDLRGRPLYERKTILETLMKDAPSNLYFSKQLKGDGKQLFASACKLNLEGIVGKKADSVYSGARNGDWVKLKCYRKQEFVIGGYTLSDKKTVGVSSLLLGYYDGEILVYAGRAGTGFSEGTMRKLEKAFERIKRSQPPFSRAPGSKKDEKVFWLEPEMVAEIKFAEWTSDKLLRQAGFQGLRADKRPKEVRMEIPEDEEVEEEAQNNNIEKADKTAGRNIGGIRISNPDKIIFENPVITKADVAEYYAKVGARMLPFAGNRVLSIVRCPKGIAQPCFFKKHPGPDSKGIVIVPVTTSDGQEDYFYIDNPSGFVSEAQMGTLEFHVWASRADNLERPDIMVFDLDPDEGMEIGQIRRGVKDLKSLLDRLSLDSFLKVSGGKGYHVVVPFEPSADWNAFYAFARRIAELMETQWPDLYTGNVRKEKRKGKIFIDWMRNGRGATSIAPYSLRARKGARVAAPLAWEELDTVAPDAIDMQTALSRLGKADPWKDFFNVRQKLK
ncbi:MAG: DNA ligase D [Clostridia bacterium]|nr:DNA ligase D [Clostridia bacterium]